MKRLILASMVCIAMTSCGGDAANNDIGDTKTDSVGLTNPISIDTTKHPEGMTNQNVISTDTAAMNMQNSVNKAKESQKKQ